MATAAEIARKVQAAIRNVGREVIHFHFPRDIEAYHIILELVDGEGQTIRSVYFPIMPHDLSEEHTEVTKVTQTLRGTHVLKTQSHTPRMITLKGMFSRQFALVDFGSSLNSLSGGLPEGTGSVAAFSGSLLQRRKKGFNEEAKKEVKKEFSRTFKTGFGALSLIGDMKELSKKRGTNGLPNFLILYLPTFGANYIVEFTKFVHAQNRQTSNMLPSYQMEFKTAALLEEVIGGGLFAGYGTAARASRRAKSVLLHEINRRIRNPIGSAQRLVTEVGSRASRLA